MDFTFNENRPANITFNGLVVNELKFNGTTVWQNTPPIIVPTDAATITTYTATYQSQQLSCLYVPNQHGYTGDFKWIGLCGFNNAYILSAKGEAIEWRYYDSNSNPVAAENVQLDTPYYFYNYQTGRYAKNILYSSSQYNTNIGSDSSISNADQYYFEATGTSGEYHLYTYINGDKYYLRYLSMDYHYYGNSQWDIPTAILIDDNNQVYGTT